MVFKRHVIRVLMYAASVTTVLIVSVLTRAAAATESFDAIKNHRIDIIEPNGSAQNTASRPVTKGLYDPNRDAGKDIANALDEAKRTNRHVLIDVGGEWCSWCHTMDRFFDDHPDLAALRDRNYVFVRVNFSPENENKAVLSRFPAIQDYPHLFVLDADGKLLVSQRTNVLESGQSYDLARFTEFLTIWRPKR